MPRFFLNINSGEAREDGDDALHECASDARLWADRRLFALAQQELGRGHEPTVVLLMRDERDVPVYRAILAMQGTWLVGHEE